MPCQLRTFGGLGLFGPDGEPIEPELAHTKGTALLAFLATRPPEEDVRREEILTLLWPERRAESARNALRSMLSRLRGELPNGALGGKGKDRLWIDASVVDSDVRAFQRAWEKGRFRAVLSLYRGPFLEHFHISGAQPFRRWMDQMREKFRDEAYEAALAVGRSSRAADELDDAQASFRRALELRPLRENGALGLVQVLAERGRTAEALQRFEAFRTRREQELELAPSEEFRSLVERTRAGEVERAASVPDEARKREVADASTDGTAPEPRNHADTTAVPADRGIWWRRPGLIATATLLAAASAGGLWLLAGGDGGPPLPGAGDRSVAVLPFEAIGTENPDPIAEGLHSDLLTRLSTVGDLEAISATSVERFRDTDLPLPAIADSLGVKWIVEGEVQQSGNAIQVNAQLVNPRTDTHAWADTYRRELTAEGLFELQSEITKKIARSLKAQLTPEETERVRRRPTEDLQAYRLYVQGRRHLSRRTSAGARKASRYFRQAVERDSAFALAWTGLADLVSLAEVYGWNVPRGSLPDPRDAAERALQLNPNLAEAHATLGRLAMDPRGQRDAPAAYRSLRRAVDLKPSYAEGHHRLGYFELAFGDLDRAVDHLSTAVDLDPGLYPAWGTLAWAEFARDAPEEAISHIEWEFAARRGLAEDGPAYVQALRDRAIALYLQGRYAEAERISRREFFKRERGRPSFGMVLVAVEAARGGTVRAKSVLARMQENDAPPAFLGVARAAMGDIDGAFEVFFRQDALWPPGAVVLLRHWFPEIMEPVRSDPRFPDLVRKIERSWKLEPDGSFGGLQNERR